MRTANQIHDDSELAKSLAAEDIRCGDVVAILDMVYEYPSFMWDVEQHVLSPHDAVCVRGSSRSVGRPLRVKAICLPYVLVKSPGGRCHTVDVRRCRLVRLSKDYAKMAWKQFRKVYRNRKKKTE